MKPEQFAKLPTHNGSPVVTLMTEPEGAGSFVSFVDRGANGRRVVARKGLEVVDGEAALPGPGALQDAGQVVLDQGQSRADNGSWFYNLFRGIFARSEAQKAAGLLPGPGPELALKDGEARTFNEALAPAMLDSELWRYQDALRQSLSSALCDNDVADKRAAWALSLGQFTTAVLGLVDRIPVSKRIETAAAMRRENVEKEGRVLSRATLGIIRQALEAGRAATAALDALIGAAEPAAKAEEDDVKLDATTLAALADQAGQNAVKVAKSLDPQAKPEALQVIYQRAVEGVVKSAVGGPAQPALPTQELQRQQSQSGMLDGTVPDPLAQFQSVIDGLGKRVAKMDETLHGKAAEGSTPAVPGILDVVLKQTEALDAISARVQKSLSIPAAPTGDEADQNAETVRKGEGKAIAPAFSFIGG